MLILYVVCLLFYAIGSVLVNLILFLIGQDWTIDYFSYLRLGEDGYLYCLVQRHRPFVPAFGTFLLQLFVHV